ncbi:MAG: hypothetical protein ACD_9C00269G0001 [uncultured bacterium]|nr:MAG: hypothetical protein ACD_9C00269G0001 [uncultured bacterium]
MNNFQTTLTERQESLYSGRVDRKIIKCKKYKYGKI